MIGHSKIRIKVMQTEQCGLVVDNKVWRGFVNMLLVKGSCSKTNKPWLWRNKI
ncbi:hypothetical protein VII00023_00020 [Vibrio ichthyoenteri ATCC 700023]|uniref:Uncharacterized protein n=1 Tax=Vibrio ichthyoenteri ATCC 700023 TaxID=870968 RepID=F9S1A8_9VIBR|nr:hypothetical protein VII00023_00020 [Vibrio ichthyoenteri ATCC 700023]